MGTSRVTRVGASLLLGLALSAGLTSSAVGASAAHPTAAAARAADVEPAASYTISGTVTGAGGSPLLQGVIVTAGSSPNSYQAATLADGTYTIDVPAGTYVLSLVDPQARYLNGYYDSSAVGGSNFTTSAGAETTVTVGPSKPNINVQLGSGFHIKGTVDDTFGSPITNIQVQAYISSGYQAVTTTASNGTFAALVPGSASYTVAIVDPYGTYTGGYYASNVLGHITAAEGSDTPVAVSGSDVTILTVTMEKPWTITLGASATTVKVGTSVTLTGTANQALDNTPYYCVIEDSSNTVLAFNGNGTTCTTTVSSSTLASKTYHAVVGGSDGSSPLATSSTVTVTWTPDHLILSPANATIQLGASETYTAIGVDGSGNSLGDVTSSTTFGTSGNGSCAGAVCTPTYAGTAIVAASDGNAHGSTTLNINGSTYHAITPTRALDTRNGTGGLSGPFTNHAARTFTVSGVPSNATAVTGNLTVTGQTSSGYLYIGPVATNNPTSSTLNFPAGDDRANAVTVALGAGGTLSITFVAPSNGPTAQAIFDVTGYFTPDTSGATYHPIAPTRALDTRSGTGGLSGPFTNHAARTFTVAGVPAGATAVTGNLTVTGQTSSGYLYIGPVATNNPTSSTLNFPAGDDRANAVTVQLGAGGTLSITFVSATNGPSAQAIFDVTGYFTQDMTGATYVPLSPTRDLDTRSGTGGLSGPFTNHTARTFTVAGIPSGATAVTGNLTVTGQTSSGFLFIGPAATNNPTSSTLNFPVGDDRANAVAVQLGTNGTLSITFVAPSNGPTAQAIFDLTGYFVSQGL